MASFVPKYIAEYIKSHVKQIDSTKIKIVKIIIIVRLALMILISVSIVLSSVTFFIMITHNHD